MKRSFILFLLVTYFAVPALKAQSPPLSADAILKEASQQAAKEKKNVFIMFHASWCGWCHRMDSLMNMPSVKDYFTRNYVIRHLVVYESEGKKNLENPGAEDMLVKYHGDKQGIPYWLVFDPKGNLLADSKKRPEGGGLETGDNTGCPATEEEVAHFVQVLKKTSRLDDKQLETIAKVFKK